MRDYKKLGHQAPKKWRINDHFNYVYIAGDLHYCYSHDFVYNEIEEERKLYNAEPCFYTDARYQAGAHNYFKDCYLYHSRHRWGKKYSLSLKACMRIVEQCRNIPVGTIVEFQRDWYYTSKKSGRPINMNYYYKVREENRFDPQYEINAKRFSRDFDTDEWAQELTAELRANGFIVGVSKGNPDFISGMLATAAAYSGQQMDVKDNEGQIATAYGHGMIVGFSTANNDFRGYSNGCDSVLFDYFQEFDKWSRCLEISKKLSPKEIVEELLKPREE